MDIPKDYIKLQVEYIIKDFVNKFPLLSDKQLERLESLIMVELKERDLKNNKGD